MAGAFRRGRRPGVEGGAAPRADGAEAEPQQVSRAGHGQPAEDAGQAGQQGGQPGHHQHRVQDVAAAESGDGGDKAALPQARRNGVGPVHAGGAGQGAGNHQEGEEQLGIHGGLQGFGVGLG